MTSLPLFFDDEITAVRKKAVLKQLPPVPDTGWLPVSEFPNLSAAKVISFDVETKETDFDHGPGWGRGQGHIVGIGIGADDGYGNIGKWYLPMRHEHEPQYNLDPAHVVTYARDVLQFMPNVPKVGANITYDVGWLSTENITVTGEFHDVQFAEALLSEDTEVNLDHLGSKYLGIGKAGMEMYRWQAEAYGGAVGGGQRANIYRTSPRLVGHYGEGDVALPLQILRKQFPLLQNEGLGQVYRMECDLISLMVKMRLKGVTIDLPKVEKLYADLGLDLLKFNHVLKGQLGFEVNVNSGDDLAKAFDHFGIKYGRTAGGAPSFTKDFLKAVDHPLGHQIIEIRMLEKMRGTFLKSYLLDRHCNGKVHGTFSQLRSDGGGTRSGRFASDAPNLQNVPVRPGITEDQFLSKKSPHYDPSYVAMGKRIRSAFIPDEGHVCWEKGDFSQIQYRYLVHYAEGAGSDEVRAEYCNNPKTDYHDITQQTVERVTGLFIERKPIKNINFGLLFGMGKDKLARQIGVSGKLATEMFNAYHTGAPYVAKTMDVYSRLALETGEITTIGGRKSRFNLWEPVREKGRNVERQIALPYDRAINQYGSRIQRAYGHKALNRLLQGGEGDHMKTALWRCYKEGVFDCIGVPRLTVHDELGFSVENESAESNACYAYMHHVMENAIPLRIPVLYDSGRGPNWGAID